MASIPPKIPDLRAQPLKEFTFEDIDDKARCEKTRKLKKDFSDYDTLYIYLMLLSYRDDRALTWGFLNYHGPAKFWSKVNQIKDRFPNATEHQLRDVLIASLGDCARAEMRLEDELAQAEVQIAIPPQDHANPPHITPTSSTSTSHVKGVKSFTMDTRTHTSNDVKKPVGNAGSIEGFLDEDWDDRCSKQTKLRSLLPLKEQEEEEGVESPIQASHNDPENEDGSNGNQGLNDDIPGEEESLEEKILRLRTLFPRAGLVACEIALDAFNGDIDGAFDMLKYQFKLVRSRGRASLQSSTGTSSSPRAASPVRNVSRASSPGEDNADGMVDVQDLFQCLLFKVPEDECRTALETSGGNLEVAFKHMSALHKIFDQPSPAQRRLCPSKLTPDDSPPPRLKRKAECSLSRIPKKIRGELDEEENGADTDGGEDDAKMPSSLLLPAGLWVKNTWRERSMVVVLLGNDEVRRDNIPGRVLGENFQLLNGYIRTAVTQAGAQSSIQIRLPEVSPEAFDLVVQFAVCGDITLEDGANEEKITSILNLVGAAIHLEAPSVTSIINWMVSKLKGILCRQRRALKRCHIRAAYDMKDGFDIQNLFASSVVKQYLSYKGHTGLENPSEYEDDQNNDTSASQQAKYSDTESDAEFALVKEMKRIPKFEKQVWAHTFNCWASRERETRREAEGNNPEVVVAVYTCPLSGRRFEL